MLVTVQMTIHPFREGEDLPSHAQAAMTEFRDAGLDVKIEAFGLVISGESGQVLEALAPALLAAMAQGGSRILLSLEVS